MGVELPDENAAGSHPELEARLGPVGKGVVQPARQTMPEQSSSHQHSPDSSAPSATILSTVAEEHPTPFAVAGHMPAQPGARAQGITASRTEQGRPLMGLGALLESQESSSSLDGLLEQLQCPTQLMQHRQPSLLDTNHQASVQLP